MFDLGVSRALAVVLSVLHGGALVLGTTLPVQISMRLALTALVALSLYRTLRRYALRRSRDAVVALAFGDGDECALRRRDSAEWEQGRLVSRWVQPLAAILVLRSDGRRPENVVVTADTLDADVFRRLRVRLCLRTAAAPEPYRAGRSADRKKGSPA